MCVLRVQWVCQFFLFILPASLGQYCKAIAANHQPHPQTLLRNVADSTTHPQAPYQKGKETYGICRVMFSTSYPPSRSNSKEKHCSGSRAMRANDGGISINTSLRNVQCKKIPAKDVDVWCTYLYNSSIQNSRFQRLYAAGPTENWKVEFTSSARSGPHRKWRNSQARR